ncbi:MAG: hypothetical protein FWE37_02050 [Spirochaetaceae bacterium]|nr:hypothetical protein [Spirochaetaceae bacterium]
MNLQTLSTGELQAKLNELESQYVDPTAEVYARIVGYYRSVRNWNVGKRAEFNERLNFELNNGQPKANPAADDTNNEPLKCSNNLSAEAVSYQLFTKASCPNCPSVKSFVEALAVNGQHLSVDEEANFALAKAKKVLAAPTVIFYDVNGNELCRANNLNDLQSLFTKAA